MVKCPIPEKVPEMPLSRYLARAYPMAPAWAIRDALLKKDVRVNGEKASGDKIVRGGDILTLYLPDKYLTGDVRVLFCDGHLIAVEKPAGLPVDVDQDFVGADTLLARVQKQYPAATLCHRLDTGTGGVLLLSLDDKAREAVLAAFRAHRVQKIYQAVCVGRPEKDAGTLRGYLQKDAKRGVVKVIKNALPGALPIETRYRVLLSPYRGEAALSLIEVELITGRTHQIRAHMASIGHPLLGDDKYGDREVNRRFHESNPALFCVSLKLGLPGYEDKTFVSEPAFTK